MKISHAALAAAAAANFTLLIIIIDIYNIQVHNLNT